MSYQETVLARNPVCYWKLESANSVNLGSREPGLYANYTNNSEFNFDFTGIDDEDSCIFVNKESYLSIGTCGFTPSALWKSFSIEFFVKLDYEYCKNIRLPIVWKDFNDDGTYTNQTGNGMAVYMTPVDGRVFLEVYLFDDTNNPAFYDYILAKEDQQWYQFTITSELINDDQQYLHSIYLDGSKIAFLVKNVPLTKPQFGDDHFWFNRSRQNAGFVQGEMFGYIDEISVYDRALSTSEVEDAEAPSVPDVFSYTPTAAGLNDMLIIDGIHYDYTPSDWQDMGEDYRPNVKSTPILDLDRVIIKHAKYEDSYGVLNHRKLIRQEWTIGWQNGAFMDKFMRDHLFNLYSLQRSFWIQYDDEMSRTCVRLHNVADNYRAYYTPTFPIAAYGWDPKNNRAKKHRRNVFVNGLPTTAFSVDEETGTVVFDDDLTSTDKVTMNYTWRCRVRVKSFNVSPSNDMPNMYIGTVTVEQVEPNSVDDHWTVTYPDQDDIPYGSGPSDDRCSVEAPKPPSHGYSAPSGSGGVDTDTSHPSDVSQGYSEPSHGVDNTGYHMFKYYKNIKAYGNLATIYEAEWNIGMATNMGILGCDEAVRFDEGITPRYVDVQQFYSGPNDGDFYDFESQFMTCYFPYDIDSIPNIARILGIQIEVEYNTSQFRLDESVFEEPVLEVYRAKDISVLPVVGGRVQNHPSHNRAKNYTLNLGYAANNPPFYETHAHKVLTYGGSTDLWGRNWTVQELKGNFGVAIKTHTRVHGAYFSPYSYNSVINRHPTKIWCVRHKISWSL